MSYVYDDELSDNKSSSPFFSLKKDNDLYDEEEGSKKNSVFKIKRSTKKEEIWEVMKDDDSVFSLNAKHFNLRQRAFLRSYEGFLFLMEEYNKGNRSVAKIRKSLKQVIGKYA